MPSAVVDAHCHLDAFSGKALESLPKGIIPVACGYSHKSNVKTVEIAKRLHIPFCLGIAPQTALKEGTEKLGEWMGFIADNAPNAIGECGLDYHWGKTPKERELEEGVFREMVALAEKMGLPLVVHSREAEGKCLGILEENGWKRPFMMHFFSGSPDDAARVVDMGGIISIVGLHSKNRRKVIEETPLEKLVAETDAPYVTRNIDGVFMAIKYISEVKGIPEEMVAEATAGNAIRFFGIRL